MRTADAQGLVNDVRWAVVDFVDKTPGSANIGLGSEAAARVQDELSKFRETARASDSFDLLPRDQVTRAIEQIGASQPITDPTTLMRVAQEMQASRLVVGEISGYKVNVVNGGKQATVGVLIRVLDSASGLAVNGASVEGRSSVRPANTDDKVIIGEAISHAAAKGVPDLVKRQLSAAVLNTRNDEAIINSGSRDGFRPGMNVVVLRGPRGRETQVATARVQAVDIDSGTIRSTRSLKGISPGDKVVVIWDGKAPVPTGSGPSGGYREPQERKKVNVSAAIGVLLVIGLIALILSGGRSNDQVGAHDVQARATTTAGGAGDPAIEVSWRLDLFLRGNQTVQWLIFRDAIDGVPVGMVPGSLTRFTDTPNVRDVDNWANNDSEISSLVCEGLSTTSDAGVAGLIVGRPHNYSVRAVYRVSSLDLPNGGTGGTGATGLSGLTGGTTGLTGGTTGGTTGLTTGGTTGLTAGTTTGGTGGTATTGTGGTTGTGTTGATFCFFRTQSASSVGSATALARANLLSPASNETVTNFRNFTFTAVSSAAFPIQVGYVIQISKSPTFAGKVFTSAEKIVTGTTAQSIAISPRFPGDSLGQFLDDTIGPKTGAGDTQVWWRVGARNIADNPGPKPDAATGLPYVFSPAQAFNRP